MSENHLLSTPLSRRTVLLAGGVAIPSIWLLSNTAFPTIAHGDDVYANLRAKWKATLIGDYDATDTVLAKYASDVASNAQSLWSKLETSASRTSLWPDLTSTTDTAELTTTANRIRQLAVAAASPGSSLYNNSDLISDTVSAVDWFLAHRYPADGRRYDNWWDQQIGVPLGLNDTGVLLYDHFSADQLSALTASIAHYAPPSLLDPGATTGNTKQDAANLVWNATVAAVRDSLQGTSGSLNKLNAALAPLYADTTKGDGFYADGSFVQHTYYAYTGAYGLSLFNYLAPLLSLLDGTQWAATSDELAVVDQWALNAMRPYNYNGLMMDSVRGRAMSRFYLNDHEAGHQLIAAFLRLTDSADPADALVYRQLAKQWITSDTALDYFTYDGTPKYPLNIASIAQGRKVVTDTSIEAAEVKPESHVFTSMARALHRRPTYAFDIAMASTRIGTAEIVNKENIYGWYTGFGATYLHLASRPTQYTNEYWPTVDHYRIPGTTVDTLSISPTGKVSNASPWAGGASVNAVSAVGMELKFKGHSLSGHKSWFCTDDAVICLGSSISSSDGRTIETIIDNRNTGPNGRTTLTVDGSTVQNSPNGSPSILEARWAWINADAGYVFPERPTIKALRQDRTGSWAEINRRPDQLTTVFSRRFITLWFDHGVSPTNASYSYIVLPDASKKDTEAFSRKNDVRIVSNNDTAHAITRSDSGLTLANFWKTTSTPIAGITVDQPCSVVVQVTGETVDVAVADPTQNLTSPITVTLDLPYTRAAAKRKTDDEKITASRHGSKTVLTVDVDGAAGASRAIRFISKEHGNGHGHGHGGGHGH